MHSFAEIFFVTQGKGFFHTKSGNIPIKKGMIVIVNPVVVHTEVSSEDSPLEYAVFSVPNVTFSGNKPELQKDYFIFDYINKYEFLFDIIRVVEDENHRNRPLWQNAVLNEFNKLILFILRDTNLFSLPFDSTQKPNTMNSINLYIRSKYQDEITLDKLADYFFLNKYYIAHAYKKKYGISVMQHLSQVRCSEAKKLLETTNLPISEIAVSVGYNSISHFSETYKNIICESPAQTRKKFFETNGK